MNKILILTFFILSLCQNAENLNNTKNSGNNLTEESEIVITNDEKDKLMACSLALNTITQKDKTIHENLAKKYNTTVQNLFFNKLLSDIFEECVNKIDLKLTHKFFKNLVPTEKNFKDSDLKFLNIDYKKYDNENVSLQMTVEQQMMFYKFQKVRKEFEDFVQRTKLENEAASNVGLIDVTKVPKNIQTILFIAIFSALFLGTIYMLNQVVKKPVKKDKKKKKSQ
jgi:hypothetical protein